MIIDIPESAGTGKNETQTNTPNPNDSLFRVSTTRSTSTGISTSPLLPS